MIKRKKYNNYTLKTKTRLMLLLRWVTNCLKIFFIDRTYEQTGSKTPDSFNLHFTVRCVVGFYGGGVIFTKYLKKNWPRRHQLSSVQYSAPSLSYDLKFMHFSARDLSWEPSWGIYKFYWLSRPKLNYRRM